MTFSAASLVLVLSVLLIAWGVAAVVRRQRRGPREPRPQSQGRAIDFQSPVWNVVGVVAGVIGTIVGIIGLFK